MVGPIKPGDFVADDFETLATYENHKRVQPVYEALLHVHESLVNATK